MLFLEGFCDDDDDADEQEEDAVLGHFGELAVVIMAVCVCIGGRRWKIVLVSAETSSRKVASV